MLLVITLILFAIVMSSFEFELSIPQTIETKQEDDQVTTIKTPSVNPYAEESHWMEYDNKPIPQIPYYTHYDIIAPPAIVVETQCPECPKKWE